MIYDNDIGQDECETCEGTGMVNRCIGYRDWREPCPDCGLPEDRPEPLGCEDWVVWS